MLYMTLVFLLCSRQNALWSFRFQKNFTGWHPNRPPPSLGITSRACPSTASGPATERISAPDFFLYINTNIGCLRPHRWTKWTQFESNVYRS